MNDQPVSSPNTLQQESVAENVDHATIANMDETDWMTMMMEMRIISA